MLEKDIEKYFVQKIRRMGGKAYKWVSPGNSGVPDRIVLLPQGVFAFVELKAQGKKPTNLQFARHREIEAMGFTVLIIDSKEKVDQFVSTAEELQEGREK